MVTLAKRGVQVEKEAKDNLKVAYQRFMGAREPMRKESAGKDLIRAIVGADAIADDSIR